MPHWGLPQPGRDLAIEWFGIKIDNRSDRDAC